MLNEMFIQNNIIGRTKKWLNTKKIDFHKNGKVLKTAETPLKEALVIDFI